MQAFDKKEILRLFSLLDEKLVRQKIRGELYLVGGAVMCLVFESRQSTRDIDAQFVPKGKIRPLIDEIAKEEDLEENWLNDGVKGFFSHEGSFNQYLDLNNLKIFIADPQYLLAMKCLAMRIGPEFTDEEDIRYLLRYLNIEKFQDAKKVIEKYYPLDKFPQKSFYALEEILGK